MFAYKQTDVVLFTLETSDCFIGLGIVVVNIGSNK